MPVLLSLGIFALDTEIGRWYRPRHFPRPAFSYLGIFSLRLSDGLILATRPDISAPQHPSLGNHRQRRADMLTKGTMAVVTLLAFMMAPAFATPCQSGLFVGSYVRVIGPTLNPDLFGWDAEEKT